MVDTSILIDFYRKTDKNRTAWLMLVREGYDFAISAITKYEIYSGATTEQLSFWDQILQQVSVIPLDEAAIDTATSINSTLKQKRKQIDLADLFIAATAVTHNMPFATLNRKHFERIEALTMVSVR